MTTQISQRYDRIRSIYEEAGQGHLLHFWSELQDDQKLSLLSQLEALDINRVNRIFSKSVSAEKEAVDHAGKDSIEPLPQDASGSAVNDPVSEDAWNRIGLEATWRNEVGVLLMAGGQGTRLGSSAPKGCYDIGLPSHKSLFQYQAERIARLQAFAKSEREKERNRLQSGGKSTEHLPNGDVVIPWYIMTSGPTKPATVKFFEDNAYFGLKKGDDKEKGNVIFFEQGTLPCLDNDGKVLLESKSNIAVAPDGNGGLYAALRQPLSPTGPKRTVLSDLQERKIKYIHSYCVDNCLVRIADPVFIGYCIHKQADCAAKVVPKSHPTESVGVVARRGNKFSVVEYSEISTVQAERRDPKTGELSFRAGNIANHFYTIDFLKEVETFESELAFHIARKKIPHVDFQTGELTKPSKPNGMKLELFVFDVFPFTKHFAVLEVLRSEEFSPLKNAPGTGSDDPETSRRDLLAQHRRFLEKAGATVKEGVEIEVSPLVTYAGEGDELLKKVNGKLYSKSGVVNKLEDLDVLV